MRKAEQRLWDLIRPKLSAAHIMSRRVENVVDEGFPDVLLVPRGAPMAVAELKARPVAPVRHTSLALGEAYGLRQSQKNWWLEFTQQLGHGIIIAKVGAIVYGFDAIRAQSINAMSFEEFCDTADAMGVSELIQLIYGRAPR
jgi:hypothetical protein